jgi:hypothetical protein
MNKLINGLLVTMVIAILASCGANQESKSHNINNPNLREVVVKEVVQTSSYTYLKMKEEGAVYWGAIPRRDDIEEGGTYYFDHFMEMKDFPSKELDKTFASLYFIEEISDEPFAANQIQATGPKGSNKVGDMEIELMDPPEGGITIGELYANREKYQDKEVTVRGRVVKYTEAVMKKNWVHIQDGSSHGKDFDLTITTTDKVENNQVVTFKGKIILNKDFGHGYAYDVLMEDAELTEVENGSVF